MLKYLRFLLHDRKLRELYSLGFPQRGLGIQHRLKHFAPYWREHLEHCLKTQTEWLHRPLPQDNKTLIILGAGRLSDVAVEETVLSSSRIHLVDADPLCREAWQMLARSSPQVNFSFHTLDLTQALHSWGKQLSKKKFPSWTTALQSLRTWTKESPLPPILLGDILALAEAPTRILSLNLLSQIPLVWQDLVEKALRHRFGKKLVQQREEEWLTALIPSAQALVSQHLRMLADSKATSILILSDADYFQYTSDRTFSRTTAEPLPIFWQSTVPGSPDGTWVPSATSNRKIQSEIFSATFGVPLDAACLQKDYFSDSSIQSLDSWLWHIAPYGLEKKPYGEINRVVALEIHRSDTRS